MDAARLLAYLPLDPEISLSWDRKTRKLKLTLPVTAVGSKELSQFVEARKGKVFRPHETEFTLGAEGRVVLEQEIPFEVSPRQALIEFWHLAKRCHENLRDLAHK